GDLLLHGDPLRCSRTRRGGPGRGRPHADRQRLRARARRSGGGVAAHHARRPGPVRVPPGGGPDWGPVSTSAAPEYGNPPSILLHGGRVHGTPGATALLSRAGRIAWIGDEDGATGLQDTADRVVHLDGALVTAAFCDA